MGIRKYDYEISVWKESLAMEGQRVMEKKLAIIGGTNMDYPGRATKPKFVKKLNGTHTLTFQMPDRYFDSKIGDYVHNELVDYLFNECKIKLRKENKWYEFVIKDVSDAKQYKSYMRTYTCSDGFIDELSRNGYGITFDEDLYNNVEEIGDFSRTILEDSVWEYDPSLNWGDFTECVEEKLFKVPLSLFGGQLRAHKVDYNLYQNFLIKNLETGKTRRAEMGDDIASGIAFWDQYQNDEKINQLLSNETSLINSKENAYIYIPYSQLDFCYVSSENSNDSGLEEAYAATEEIGYYGNKGYAIAPNSIDPNHLIQFIFIPDGEKVEVDEAGLIVNKNFTYIMTVKDWNEQIVNSELFYKFEDYKEDGQQKKVLTSTYTDIDFIHGNRAGYYDGYLNKIGDQEINYGKKISISDRTEINISDEIDQYVTVYNNPSSEYKDLFIKQKETSGIERDMWRGDTDNYKVCSKIETRQIIPQLARNLFQNSKAISSPVGWEIMSTSANSLNRNAKVELGYLPRINKIQVDGDYDINTGGVQQSYLVFLPFKNNTGQVISEENNSLANFGIVGQGVKIQKDKVYVLGFTIKQPSAETIEKFNIEKNKNYQDLFRRIKLIIGNGEVISDGDYIFNTDIAPFSIQLYKILPINQLDCEINGYFFIKFNNNYENPYIALYSECEYELWSASFFEAYTRGRDQFENAHFKYSGRDMFLNFASQHYDDNGNSYSDRYLEEDIRQYVLFEDTVMPGDTYQYNHYFIQQLKLNKYDYLGMQTTFDTFAKKEYLSSSAEINSADDPITTLPLSTSQYTLDDYEIITNYIDLNNCSDYDSAATGEFDCKFGNDNYNKVCLYQKYGYCPYRFQTEKHCRKVRTLKAEKSNRFNLTQEVGKVFKIYPMYYIAHDPNNGKVLTQQESADIGTREVTPGRAEYMDKRLYYITEKGHENKLGFRYEKNLSNISRKIDSNKIVSKLYVLDIDSTLSRTGLNSIKTAEDNPSKDSYIIDFSYYIAQGLLDKERTERDLYGYDDDLGYLKMTGYLNTQRDKIIDKIINLKSKSYTELEANLTTNLTGIETAQQQLRKKEKEMSVYTYNQSNYETNPNYQSLVNQYAEIHAIMVQLVEDTFYTNNTCIDGVITECSPADFIDNHSLENIKKDWVDTHSYTYGILGQFNKEYNQINEWTKESEKYLKKIQDLSNKFYQKYEPYLKEGTWSGSNYITDNAYYLDALNVAKEGAIPKVSYTITTVDIEPYYQQGDYVFDVADTTYIEDIGMFGINLKTGLPNRLKTIVSSIEEELDDPRNNKINVQDYTTQFDDLFQQVTATVQSLTLNENIYHRASNFTANKNIETESLQGTLDQNNLTLVKTEEDNIQIDQTGQSGSDINNHNNKYKLNGQGLFFSNNGGQTWNTGIGPDGINADYIKAGTLDASKIRIVDGSFVYFSWTKDGIAAYRDPQSMSGLATINDYNIYNRYGLSIIQDGKIKVRAGYNFTGTDGIYTTEQIQGQIPGFYLYNKDGKEIFSAAATIENSARIRVAGEILAINNTQQSTWTYSDAWAIANEETNHLSYLSLIITDLQYSVSGTVATYSYTSSSDNNLDYALHIFYKENILNSNGISEVQITRNGQLTSYIIDAYSTLWDSDHNVCLQVQQDVDRLVKSKKYEITFDNSDSYIFYVFTSGNSEVITRKAIDDDRQTRISYWSHIGDSIHNVPYDMSQTLPTAYGFDSSSTAAEGYIYYNYVIKPSYEVNAYHYLNKHQDSGTAPGTVCLYINNQRLVDDTATIDNDRLFSCLHRTAGRNNNILTIKKNGSLWMGGSISDTSSLDAIGDSFTITGEYLKIDQGKLYMRFNDIRNTQNNNQSLSDYIKQESDSAAQGETNNLRTEIYNKTHNHWGELELSVPDLSDPTVFPEFDNYDPSQQVTLEQLLNILSKMIQYTGFKPIDTTLQIAPKIKRFAVSINDINTQYR